MPLQVLAVLLPALLVLLLDAPEAAPVATKTREGLDGDSLAEAGTELTWHYFPLMVGEGQTAVKCGTGFVVQWQVQVGDYVHEGDPMAETCRQEGGTSVTCPAPRTGQVVAEQPLGPEDDILENVPDGVVAVIQEVSGDKGARTLRMLMAGGECEAVMCDDGTTFEQFLVAKGDVVDKGDVIALAVAAGGMINHCRAPVAGVVESLSADLQQGDAIASKIACVTRQSLGPESQRSSAASGNQHQTCSKRAASRETKVIVAGEHLRASRPNVAMDQATSFDDEAVTVRRLPLEKFKQQPGHSGLFGSVGGSRSTAAPVLVWCLTGMLLTSVVLLGLFIIYGKNQTRSLYMLMQDSRDDAPKGLRMDFLDGSGSEKSFNFECQPLGIIFSKQAPIKVERFEFNSYAKDRGVQLGWRVTRIAEQQVATDQTFQEVDRWLQARVKTLACWPLRVDFDTGGGVIKAFYFEKQPLGIELTKRAPFKIALFKPDSYAKACGAEIGWVLVRIGDAVVNQRTSLDVLMSYVNDGLGHLPQEPKGLKVAFREHTGNEKTFYFQRRPLGLVLTKYTPVKVEGFEFNSYAKERGVQTGWTVAQIDDQEVGAANTFDEVNRRIVARSKGLNVWPLRMDFDTGGGESRTFFFEKQPLGMELLNKLPIKVDTFKPDSYAKSCGVQIGWLITRVGDHDVTSDTKFEQVIEYLVEGVCELPPVDKDPGKPARRGLMSSIC